MKRVMVVDDERPVVEGIVLMVQRDLGEEFRLTESKLDFYAGELKIKSMQPNTARLVSIRKY